MLDKHVLRPYEVDIAPEIVEAGHDKVFDIPIDECHVLLESGVTMPRWFREVISNPILAWADRIGCETIGCVATEVLSGRLRNYLPVSIVVAGCDIYSKCARCGETGTGYFLIRELQEPSKLLGALPQRERDMFRDVCLVSSLLYGFREDYPPSGGRWLDFTNEQTLLTDEMVNGNFGQFQLTARWNPALQVYGARNGDALVFNRNQEWGWWQAGSEDGIVVSGDSVQSFARVFDRYLAGEDLRRIKRNGATFPFDSYFVSSSQHESR